MIGTMGGRTRPCNDARVMRHPSERRSPRMYSPISNRTREARTAFGVMRMLDQEPPFWPERRGSGRNTIMPANNRKEGRMPSTEDAELKAGHRKMWASGDYPSMVETFLLPLGPTLVVAWDQTRGCRYSTWRQVQETLRFLRQRSAPT